MLLLLKLPAVGDVHERADIAHGPLLAIDHRKHGRTMSDHSSNFAIRAHDAVFIWLAVPDYRVERPLGLRRRLRQVFRMGNPSNVLECHLLILRKAAYRLRPRGVYETVGQQIPVPNAEARRQGCKLEPSFALAQLGLILLAHRDVRIGADPAQDRAGLLANGPAARQQPALAAVTEPQ